MRTFTEAGLLPFGSSFVQEFSLVGETGDSIPAANVMGMVTGQSNSEMSIVISAHFDHLGIRNGRVYNGADDNASGTAALLELARIIAQSPLQHNVIFLATDAEERGMLGAQAFIANPPISLDRIALNVNMDMVSHSDSVLYAAGTYRYPALRPFLETVNHRADIVLRFGHDDPALGPDDDWTNSSDHAPFNDSGIPFVYFGVEDHEDYHRPTDDFSTINAAFYEKAVETILDALQELDHNLEAINRQ